MSSCITRRDFLKVAATGAGAAFALSGCRGAAERLALRAEGGAVATTCGECPLGCSLLAYARAGRVERLEANPAHPANPGGVCPLAFGAMQKLADPQRFTTPIQKRRGELRGCQRIGWDQALEALADALQRYQPGEVAFVLGLFPDHLKDLAQSLGRSIGASVLRFDPLGEFEGRVTLMDASQRLFGVSKTPWFDLRETEVALLFGSSGLESWLPPAMRAALQSRLAGGVPDQGSYWVQFGTSGAAANAWADECISVRPGSFTILAQALAYLVNEMKHGGGSPYRASVDLNQAARVTGVALEEMQRLARLFHQAGRKLALPGSAALGGADGPAAAESILALNILADNLGQPGGLSLAPDTPLYPWLTSRPSTIAEVGGLIERMQGGQVKALCVHGIDLVASLPASFGLPRALERVERIFSFAALPDETSLIADYILPDRLPLEAWGYQQALAGRERSAVSALQPVVRPPGDTRATADLLLAAAQVIGGGAAAALPFRDELDFLQKSVYQLAKRGGVYSAADKEGFWELWRQHGGWWVEEPMLAPPVQVWSSENLSVAQPSRLLEGQADYPFHLMLVPEIELNPKSFRSLWGLGKTIRNLRVVIHPAAAQALGLNEGSQAWVRSAAGQLRAVVALNPALQPDTLAIPWHPYRPAGWAECAAPNPLRLFGKAQNSAGNLAFAQARARVEAV